MKIRPGENQVAIILTPRECMGFAQQLIRCAMASGAQTDSERQEPTPVEGTERER